MSKLVGIHGLMRSGKDTFATFIGEWAAEQPDVTFGREGFADRLKLSAARIFFPEITKRQALDWANDFKFNGHIAILAPGDGEPEKITTGREFLQRYGTECHREVFGDNFWVDSLLPLGEDEFGHPLWESNFLDAHDFPCNIVCVTDVRFPNEAERIRELGGTLVEVVGGQSHQGATHASEAGIAPYKPDVVIHNDGTLDDLRAEAALFAESL